MLVLPVVLDVVVGSPPSEDAGCDGGGGGASEGVNSHPDYVGGVSG